MMSDFRFLAILRRAAVALAGIALAGAAAPAPAPLDRWDFEAGPSAEVRLANPLREVSGLALTPDGRLFAHDDEAAEIHELDPASGRHIAGFALGASPLSGDFEGLAFADGRFFLITSQGNIAEFAAAADRERVEYRRHETGLEHTCEVEGLAHDPRSATLLIACKEMHEGGPPGIYAFDVAARRLDPQPRYAVRTLSGAAVHPSGIVLDSATGHLLVIAARQRLILELDREGRTIAERELRRGDHPQAEGIELMADGTLLISDEGGSGRGRLAWYRPVSSRP